MIMKQFTSLSTLGNGIISPQALQHLVDYAPDKESLLTIKFCFNLYTSPNELSGLNVGQEFLYDEEGRLIEFMVGKRTPRLYRRIPIDASSAKILPALLPDSGLLFLNAKPFERLKRFAERLGIHIGARLARRSSAAYGRAEGLTAQEVAARMGLNPSPFDRHVSIPVTVQQFSGAYFNLDFALDRISGLPRYSGRLKSAVLQNRKGDL